MAIDNRFSAERFRALDPSDPQAVASLLGEFEQAVAAELHDTVAVAMAGIATRLNELGHRLKLGEDGIGEVEYRDFDDPADGEASWLRLNADTIVSSGWREPQPAGPGSESAPSMWEVRLLVETDDPAELERITEAVAAIGCPIPVQEHDTCPTPWFVVATLPDHLDEDEAGRWRSVLNRE